MTHTTNNQPTLLLFSDDKHQQQELEIILSELDCQIIIADDIATCLELFLQKQPSIIVIDIVLQRDIFELCSQIRTLPGGMNTSLLPILPDDDDTIHDAFEAGANDCITRPIKPVLLQKRTANMLASYKQIDGAQDDANKSLEVRDYYLQAEALRDTAESLNNTLDLDEVLQHILSHINRVFPCETANVMLIEDGEAHIVAHLGYERLGIDTNWLETTRDTQEIENIQKIVGRQKPVAIADTHSHHYWSLRPETAWIRSYLGAPIIVDNKTIGIINVEHRQPNHFDDTHAQRLIAFANQVGVAIKNAHLHETIQRHAEQLEITVEQRTQELINTNQSLNEQIIECQKMEDQLAEERNRLRTLIDNIPDEINVKDQEGHIILANKSFVRRLSRYMPETEVIGSTNSDYMPEELAQHNNQIDSSILNAIEIMVNEEILIQGGEEGDQWFSTTKVPLYDGQKEVVGIIGINHNIADMKLAEERLTHVISGAYCLLWYAIVEDDGEAVTWDIHIPSEEAAQSFLPLSIEPGKDYMRAWQDNVLPEDKQLKDAQGNDAIRANKSSYQHEYRCFRADGKVRWLHEEVQVRPLTPGRYSAVGICTDVTERRLAEETLQHANELLEQRVAERTEELVHSNQILRDEVAERIRAEHAEREQRILADTFRNTAAVFNETLNLNEVLDRILSYAGQVVPPHRRASVLLIEDEIYVRSLRTRDYLENGIETTSPEDRLYLSSIPRLRHILDSGKPLIVDDMKNNPLWQESQPTQWLSSYIGVPIHAEGQIIGFINLESDQIEQFMPEHAEHLLAFSSQAGIAIQNARLFEAIRLNAASLRQRVAESTAELEHERAQLHAILDAMADGVIYYDDQSTPKYINQSLIELTGYSSEEWLKGIQIWSSIMSTSSGDDFLSMLMSVQDKVRHLGIWHGEAKLTRRNGNHFDARMVATSVLGADDNPAGMVLVIRDVSTAKRLENQKSRFIATASHELRTPITNVKTRLYLIKRQPEKLQDHLAVIAAVTDRMHKLVEDLLDVSRFDHGTIILDYQEVVLQDLIGDVIKVQEPEAINKGLNMLVDMPPGDIFVQVDRARMTQVITNLITNAIHYTAKNGEITINLTAKEEFRQNIRHHYAVIEISDTGIGISTDAIDNVFKPFFRVNEYQIGAGLGLSIAKEIIELHEAEMTIESAENKGTSFTIKLDISAHDQT